MTRDNKCASCLHCEMCKWIDEVNQNGCDFYAEPCENAVSRSAVLKINESHRGEMPNEVNYQMWKEIRALPPAQSEEKRENNLSGLSSNATLGDIILAVFPDFMKNTLLISNEEDFKTFAELGKNLVRLEDWNTPCKGGEK